MNTAVTAAVEAIPLPDVDRLEQMPSLPEWVGSLVASMRNEMQKDSAGKYREIPTLPANLFLSDDERDKIACHLAGLKMLDKQTPSESDAYKTKTFAAVIKMMLVLPTAQQNEASAEARGEVFMIVLDDLPYWAAAAAIRRFYKGDAANNRGEPYDCHWCPSPADLRIVAMQERWRLGERINSLGDLLRAEVRDEFNDEHCAAMRARIATLIRFTPLVGKDGSGEGIGRPPIESATVGPERSASPA